jgi:N-acetylglucosaminyl-diphospho-decaprenol L-rhamnosyltransferase
MPEPDASLIVVSYNTRDATLACVASLLREQALDIEVLVVDNDSRDGTVEALAAAHPEVTSIAPDENLGFAKACNIGARHSRGRYLGFVNSDCVVEPGCIFELVTFLDRRSDVSVAVPRLISGDGTVQVNIGVLPSVRSIASEHLLGRVPDPYRVAELVEPTAVAACSGAALLIRREDFWAVGGFHEAYFMYVEDVELCKRLAAQGKRICYLPGALARHEQGGSSERNSDWLATMMLRNREDYVHRTMGTTRAAAGVAALRLGRAITPLRNRLVAALRRRQTVESRRPRKREGW